MADLSAVLQKTIDALPSASPQLRAKVYEKARAAIERQIANANPPFTPEVAEARRQALEDAIQRTEGGYAAGEGGFAAAPPPPPVPEPVAPPPAPTPPPYVPVQRPEPETRSWAEEPVQRPEQVADMRAEPARPEPGPEPVAPEPVAPDYEAEPEPKPALPPFVRRAAEIPVLRPAARGSTPAAPAGDGRIGEIGPLGEDASIAAGHPVGAAPLPEHESSDGSLADQIPEADMAAPNYARSRKRRSSGSLLAGVAALLFVGALGALGWIYSDDIGRAVGGGETVATTEPESEVAAVEQEPAAEPEVPVETAAPDPSSREFTQRLLPDGSEVDEGPAVVAANAFDEGTDVAPASPILAEEPPALSETPETPPQTAGAGEAIPVGQRAVFYEERSAEREGSQQTGNVVWSLVNEPPATGEPAEPAIRGVVDIGGNGLEMTMTIRRNADETLPASHVIEILFDTPADFPGGEIANVQRLALKPTEQARGEPLIGVAGKISDGFFIIALNDLQQAVDNNVALMANEEWIDIPVAYASGQRALVSLEKGIPGDRVFEEALAAWAARS